MRDTLGFAEAAHATRDVTRAYLVGTGDVYGLSLAAPPMADVDDLEVTERVVTETLRLFPPVYSLARETKTDVAFDGYRIPEGEQVLLQTRLVQRDPRFFDDPDEFRPGRWDSDLRTELHDFAYAPFGGGPRICIGRQFALLEPTLALAAIGREYELY